MAGLTGADAELLGQWNFGNNEYSFPGGETVAAFADGRAEALTEGQLKALGFESILDSNLEKVN